MWRKADNSRARRILQFPQRTTARIIAAIWKKKKSPVPPPRPADESSSLDLLDFEQARTPPLNRSFGSSAAQEQEEELGSSIIADRQQQQKSRSNSTAEEEPPIYDELPSSLFFSTSSSQNGSDLTSCIRSTEDRSEKWGANNSSICSFFPSASSASNFDSSSNSAAATHLSDNDNTISSRVNLVFERRGQRQRGAGSASPPSSASHLDNNSDSSTNRSEPTTDAITTTTIFLRRTITITTTEFRRIVAGGSGAGAAGRRSVHRTKSCGDQPSVSDFHLFGRTPQPATTMPSQQASFVDTSDGTFFVDTSSSFSSSSTQVVDLDRGSRSTEEHSCEAYTTDESGSASDLTSTTYTPTYGSSLMGTPSSATSSSSIDHPLTSFSHLEGNREEADIPMTDTGDEDFLCALKESLSCLSSQLSGSPISSSCFTTCDGSEDEEASSGNSSSCTVDTSSNSSSCTASASSRSLHTIRTISSIQRQQQELNKDNTDAYFSPPLLSKPKPCPEPLSSSSCPDVIRCTQQALRQRVLDMEAHDFNSFFRLVSKNMPPKSANRILDEVFLDYRLLVLHRNWIHAQQQQGRSGGGALSPRPSMSW